MPDDDMGKGKITEGGASLTMYDFKKIASGWGMSLEETMKNTRDMLNQDLNKMEHK
jgi:hypothetical protein